MNDESYTVTWYGAYLEIVYLTTILQCGQIYDFCK